MEEQEDHIIVNLPVRIKYEVVQEYFRQELVGELIKKEEKPGKETAYAEILSLSVDKSTEKGFDLVFHLKIRSLLSLYKNKILQISLHASLEFSPQAQRIFVREFSLHGNNNGWFTNRVIEVLANSFLYKKLKAKLDFELLPVIRDQVSQVNQKLSEKMEVYQGIRLSGELRHFRIADVIPAEKYLVISVELRGNALVDIDKLSF